MEKLRHIQMAYGIPVQSHLSESKGKNEFVKFLRPDDPFWGDGYNEYDLFGKNDDIDTDFKTDMAHCVWSTGEEVELMRKNGVFVAHCPASNMNLTSGIVPIRKYMDLGLNIGLGSDIAGGRSDSVFRAIADAIQVSKMYFRMVDESVSRNRAILPLRAAVHFSVRLAAWSQATSLTLLYWMIACCHMRRHLILLNEWNGRYIWDWKERK